MASTGRQEPPGDRGQSGPPLGRDRERLAGLALKIPPREQAENAALLARAPSALRGADRAERTRIGAWITAFMAVLERQDPREIGDAPAGSAARSTMIDTDLLPG
ncbi:MAG: hypothetical protein U1E53_20140 [Dongiaceae bacterium]